MYDPKVDPPDGSDLDCSRCGQDECEDCPVGIDAVVIRCDGGILSVVSRPENVAVVILDYDIDNLTVEEANERVRTDKHGKQFFTYEI